LYTVEEEQPDEVLILSGDHIYKMNYYALIDFHRKTKADLTVSVVEVAKEQSPHLGVVETDQQHWIKGFQEKPRAPRVIPGAPDKIYASMGIYVFNADVLATQLKEDAVTGGSAHDFGKDIIPHMLNQGYKIAAYNFRDENNKEAQYWRDIGTIDAYYEANMDLVQVDPIFNLYDRNWPLRTYQEQFPPVKTVFSGDEITGRVGLVLDSLVSSGCIVSGGRVQRSILSPDVRINSYSQVYDSILMEGVNVGRYSKIRKAIIDKDVNIPPGTVIGHDLQEDKRRFFVSEGGIVVVPKGAHLT
jgi:glucose-1-phosphate adenylyltransferase